MKTKNKKAKKTKNQIILNKNLALITAFVVNLVISIFGANAFYKIITKIAPNSYDASFAKTMYTVAPLLFIGVSIVLLFILLISQTNIED